MAWFWTPALIVAGAALLLLSGPEDDLGAIGGSFLFLSVVLVIAAWRGGAMLDRSRSEIDALQAGRPIDAFAMWTLTPRTWWLYARHLRAESRKVRFRDLLMLSVLPVTAGVTAGMAEGFAIGIAAAFVVSLALAAILWWALGAHRRRIDHLQRAAPRVALTSHAILLGDEAIPWHVGGGITPMGRGRVLSCRLIEDAPLRIEIVLHYPMSRGETTRRVQIPAPEDPLEAARIVEAIEDRMPSRSHR